MELDKLRFFSRQTTFFVSKLLFIRNHACCADIRKFRGKGESLHES